MQPAILSTLWTAAIERLVWLRAIFGSPIVFLRRDEDLTRAEVREVLSLLRPLERLVRSAILLAALTVHGPPPPRASLRRIRTKSPRKPCWPGQESSAWRGVRFRILEPAARSKSGASTSAAVVYRLPLAKRMEAVARVLADPGRWVRTLAKTLRTRMTSILPRCRRLAVCDAAAPADLVEAAAHVAAALRDTS